MFTEPDHFSTPNNYLHNILIPKKAMKVELE